MAEFDVLDCHHHVGDVQDTLGFEGPSRPGDAAASAAADAATRAAAGATTGGATDIAGPELAARLATMDRNGVAQAVVIPGHGYLRPQGLADTRRVNDAIAAYRDAAPTRFPAAVGIVEPLYGPAGLAEVDRCADSLGLRGISFHTRFQGVATDSPLVRALVDRCGQRGLTPFVHAVGDHPDEALWQVLELGRGFPDVTFLVLDAFSSFEQCRQAVSVAELAPNLVFDTSLAYTFDLVMPFVRRHGASRLVYGSDLYSAPLGYRRTHVLGQILEADLTDADKAKILSGTTRAVLGLEPRPGPERVPGTDGA